MTTESPVLHIDVPVRQIEKDSFLVLEKELRKIESTNITENEEKTTVKSINVAVPLAIIQTLIYIVTEVEKRMSQPPETSTLRNEKPDFIRWLIAVENGVPVNKVTPEFVEAAAKQAHVKMEADAKAEGLELISDDTLETAPFVSF